MRTELVTTLKRRASRLRAEIHALQQRVALLEGIARGERAVEQGRMLSHAHAKARMRRWLA